MTIKLLIRAYTYVLGGTVFLCSFAYMKALRYDPNSKEIPLSKTYGDKLVEAHEAILERLDRKYPLSMPIGEHVTAYLSILREMRPNDGSLAFIDGVQPYEQRH